MIRFVRLLLGMGLCLAALPWLLCGANAAGAVGLFAFAIGIAVTFSRGHVLLIAFSAVMLLLIGLSSQLRPPVWSPLEIGGIPYVGRLRILPYAAPAVAAVVILLRAVGAEGRNGASRETARP